METEPCSYHLRTCTRVVETFGMKAKGFQIESLDDKVVISLLPLLESFESPNNRTEIPTPNAVFHPHHLHHFAKHISELDREAGILLLLGRDVLRVHKVRQQVNRCMMLPLPNV